MDAVVVSKTVRYGKQHWRINADGSFSALAFGSFGPNQVGLKYGWITVERKNVPPQVRETLEK